MTNFDPDLKALLERCGFVVHKDGAVIGREANAAMLRGSIFGSGFKSGWNGALEHVRDLANQSVKGGG